MFLLDANVIIAAHRDYYPPDRVPEYWSWLAHHAGAGKIFVPKPIWDELTPHDQDLKDWLSAHQDDFVLNPDDSDVHVSRVLAKYGNNLTDNDLERIGADPFLIAAAIEYDATVVTKEGEKPSLQGVKRRIPDICRELGIDCITDHRLIVELNFRTNWRP